MTHRSPVFTRRHFARAFAFGVAGAAGLVTTDARLFIPGVFAHQLIETPKQTEGPFYPDKMPLDTDNDLLVINDAITPAVGEVTYLTGRILDRRGSPVRNAVVEIWQCDASGAYLHSKSDNGAKRDANFQGFGRFLTGSTGEYAFRTIKPIVYPGRQAPHIHYAVKVKGQEKFTTQCYIKGHPGNARDGVLKGIRDPKALATVMVDFAPVKDARAGELAARFDIVLGYTPAS